MINFTNLIFSFIGQEMVKDIKFYMAKEFVDNIYSSCENIVNPSSNSKVMGKL